MDSIAKKDLIIYIHGWNSSGNARKAKLLKDELATNTDYEVASYTLKSHPREAIKQLTEIIESGQAFSSSIALERMLWIMIGFFFLPSPNITNTKLPGSGGTIHMP